MAEIVAIEVEARLLRWGDSSTAGRTITLELDPDAGEHHPFRGYLAGAKNGTRFRLLFVPIGDDEMPVIEPPKEPATSEEAPAGSLPQTKPRNPDAADRARQNYRDKDIMAKAAARAGMLPKDKTFQRWVVDRMKWAPGNASEDAAVVALRDLCDITSRSEIGTSWSAYEAFLALETDYNIAVGRAARPS